MRAYTEAWRLAARLNGLVALIKPACPGARVHPVEGAESGFPGFQVRLPNGIDVVVGVDIELPHVLYEVVRLQVAGEIAQYHFEALSAGGFASTGRLSADAVLAMLRSYSTVPA